MDITLYIGIAFFIASFFSFLQAEDWKWHGPWKQWLIVTLILNVCGVLSIALGMLLDW